MMQGIKNPVWLLTAAGSSRFPGENDRHMTKLRTVSEWMTERGFDLPTLAQAAGLEQKTVESIVLGRYTASPQQRQKLASVLNLSPDDIHWGQSVPVDHMYGHGPQFGRSP
jgi:hypothetical protein